MKWNLSIQFRRKLKDYKQIRDHRYILSFLSHVCIHDALYGLLFMSV